MYILNKKQQKLQYPKLTTLEVCNVCPFMHADIYRVAQKVNNYREQSLNRNKPAIKARFFINFDYTMSMKI